MSIFQTSPPAMWRSTIASKRVRSYVGLGANIGDAQQTLERALRALRTLPRVRLREVSPLYRTKPVGPVDQPDFVNAVAAIDAPADPDPNAAALRLLGQLKEIERELGRRQRERWGPREIDLDLLVFGRHSIEQRGEAWLVVPHPEMANRLFVLAPLADLVPHLRPPGWRETIATALRRRLQLEGADAVRRLRGP